MGTCLNCNIRSNCRQYEVEGETDACIEYIPQNLAKPDAYSLLSEVGELLPCPFCGSKVKITSLGGDHENWCIYCDVCKIACADMGVSGETKEDIIKNWNRRANFT